MVASFCDHRLEKMDRLDAVLGEFARVCGAGNSEAWLRKTGRVGRKILFLESYTCPS
jgi:hypothetical protein